MHSLLTLNELDSDSIMELIKLGIKIKKDPNSFADTLQGKTLAMIFEKPSTRTRISFEAGMFQLGGHALILSSDQMQMSRGESIEDTAKTLSGYVDCVMARVYDHNILNILSANSTVPVINGLSNSFHPCQILANIMTIYEIKGKLDGLKLAWIGDGNNVCNSLIYGCVKSNVNIAVATPPDFKPNQNVINDAKKLGSITLTDDPSLAITDADVVMTDTFTSIHDDADKLSKFLPTFQINDNLFKLSKSDSIFLHCLPAKRDQEVTSSVIDGPQSVIWQEAENRLHAQKALLVSILT
ncbi:MAG: ornithine carbamoyltransferase [Candidatus Nitrosoabyssus spongiisocia]|nr:MAG: ornithine carbamoyltransferase [Nitrosopumilaceae archaeon AB1(1)]